MLFTVKPLGALLSLLFILCLAGCTTEKAVSPKIEEKPAVVHTIKKGSHYSDKNAVKQVNATALRFEVTFDSSAVYTSAKPNNQADINKLYGFSDCSTSHQVNSARFGWRWHNNRLEVLAYTYLNKKWDYKLLGAVPLGQPVPLELRVEEDKYVFVMYGQQVAMPRACTGTAEGYQLYPYFGGDETAPHDITISIKELQ
ncbi:hypothetical protein [Pontibacter chinhatensis]|uniref:Uncharacterized protein n=1 Tax=Pontibacter chinhatensis TaxID=1436961 RepID=A0A1I2LX68_9BACT|nr:hypothetical protein [Pontibacter chinhatensis]SFF83855.1 hypothetical protein SAMN05421739_10172 [Pontibacter chinhatensis]